MTPNGYRHTEEAKQRIGLAASLRNKGEGNPRYKHGFSLVANLPLLRRMQKAAARKTIRDAKNVPCSDCGKRYPSYVMDFDHREPALKRYNIASMASSRTPATIRREIEKCDVVCANCHRHRTHKQRLATVPLAA